MTVLIVIRYIRQDGFRSLGSDEPEYKAALRRLYARNFFRNMSANIALNAKDFLTGGKGDDPANSKHCRRVWSSLTR